MDENNLLREAFNVEVVEDIAYRVRQVHPQFDAEEFVAGVLAGFLKLSFGDRARKIVSGLERHLPSDFPKAAKILVGALGPEPIEDELSGFSGFYVMPLTMYVSSHGMNHPDLSLDALYEMTKRFSAEGDIRPFIEKHPDRTLRFLYRLTEDPSPFARRLASEGTRPRLPLFGRLRGFQVDPEPVIALLDRLYTDESLMVRRSVANNLNDISKDNPATVVATLARWKSENPSPELDWVVRHALRTLVKNSDPSALKLLGFFTKGISITNWTIDRRHLVLGDSLRFSCSLESTASQPQSLSLNYVIRFMKANGKPKPKVFRLPDKTLQPGEVLPLSKYHKFIDYRNQRFYAGTHCIELVVNGMSYCRSDFTLAVGSD
jgi:3-methyladenine DNA glycosylase AlkC